MVEGASAGAETGEPGTPNGDPAPTGVRERRRQELAIRIEHTALELFAAGGFDAVTGDDIAEAVGVSRRTIFRYFPGGKEEIVLRDLRRRLDAMRDALTARPPEESALVALRHGVMALVDGYEGDHDLAEMRSRILLSAPSLSARFIGEQLSLTAVFVEMIAARMGVDPLDDLRPAMIVGASLGAVQVGFGKWIREGGDLAALVDQCFEIVDMGLEQAVQPLEVSV
jgi:AcrR family transcriptional regulator